MTHERLSFIAIEIALPLKPANNRSLIIANYVYIYIYLNYRSEKRISSTMDKVEIRDSVSKNNEGKKERKKRRRNAEKNNQLSNRGYQLNVHCNLCLRLKFKNPHCSSLVLPFLEMGKKII